ncbi:Uncharacterized protein GBIM_13277 [Gryllus bimaculatus]|nr:Uncharacterized protein GBIM_13277 [Gryllus bimaculatus]
MAKVDHSTRFYQKMAELQEKLKRREEKRVRSLREKYEKFLEDDKRRRDRNERILQTLEKIESRASALSAKSERLKLLRRHYEAYLVRMYPLWKKQVSSTSQPSLPTNHTLTLPMDTEKGLPWFGGGSGLYSNNMPLPSARSSLSAESDQMWVPPVLPRNIPMCDNSKQTIVHKPMERKNSVIESINPAVECALDNYLQRAAELLRVPVEELEDHSEKRDEEKSVHTEQDTSRDLLNVSLSDDSILFEKKTEKPKGNAIIVNIKENIEDMIEEEKYIPEIDHMAGGDNMISNLQTDRFHQQNVLNLSKVTRSSPSAREENMYSNIVPDITNVNTNISQIQCIPSEQNLLTNNAHQNSKLKEDDKERLEISDLHNLQVISDKNIKYNDLDNIDFQEPCANAAEHKYADNTSTNDAYESVQHPASDLQLNDQLNLPGTDTETPKNVEHLHYDLVQETTNKEQECSENIGQNENDFLLQNRVIPQECIGSEDGTSLVTKSDEKEQPTVTVDESQIENYNQNEENFGLQPSDNNENYGLQNGDDIEQFKEEHCVENFDLQYEHYPISTQQYEQEQFVGDETQLYNQQYPEQRSNEQYIENSEQLVEECVNNDEYVDQYGPSEEGHLVDANHQALNYHDVQGENISEEQVYGQNEDQTYSADSEGESQTHVSSSQFAPDVGINGGDVVNMYQAEGNEIQKDNMNDQECTSQENKPTQDNNYLDEIPENKEGIIKSHVILEETMGNVEEESEVQDQQSIDVHVTEQALTQPNNTTAIEDDSEESSAGFWNPPHHSSIPSVDELAPKAAIAIEDTSESSADSKLDPPDKPHTVQQLRSLLGVPSDPAGDASVSDEDDLEDQLAALVEDPSVRTPAVVETKHNTTKEVKLTESNQKVKEGNPVPTEQSKSRSQKDSKTSKSSESAKPSTRTGLKKPPSLIKVLESDTESLNLDTGAVSNVDSDEFDFSTE